MYDIQWNSGDRITKINTPIQKEEAWEVPSSPRAMTVMKFHWAHLVRLTDLGGGDIFGSALVLLLGGALSPVFSYAFGSALGSHFLCSILLAHRQR